MNGSYLRKRELTFDQPLYQMPETIATFKEAFFYLPNNNGPKKSKNVDESILGEVKRQRSEAYSEN